MLPGASTRSCGKPRENPRARMEAHEVSGRCAGSQHICRGRPSLEFGLHIAFMGQSWPHLAGNVALHATRCGWPRERYAQCGRVDAKRALNSVLARAKKLNIFCVWASIMRVWMRALRESWAPTIGQQNPLPQRGRGLRSKEVNTKC